MATWYEVFDDEQVQLQTRQRVRRVIIALVATLGVLAVVGPLVVSAVDEKALALVGLAIIAIGALGVASIRLMRLQRVMWCVKLSIHKIVGFDYARRKTVLPWTDVERIEVTRDGLSVVGMTAQQGTPTMLCIPSRYPDFHTLSHRAAEYAEAHGVPIYVDGRPWQLLDITKVFPFLESPETEREPGSFYFDPRKLR